MSQKQRDNKNKTKSSRRILFRLLTFTLAIAMVFTSGAFCFATDGAEVPAAGEAVTEPAVPDETVSEEGSKTDPAAGEDAVTAEPDPAAQDEAIEETVVENIAPVPGPTAEKAGKAAAPAAVDRNNPVYTANPCKGRSEVRGLWIAFCDFKTLGLYNKNEATYTANLRKALDTAKKYGVNTVYFHVRSMDNAAWRSKYFPAIEDLNSNASRSKSAYDTYTYDPLVIAIREAHARGMELHAWMNPYRVSYNYFLDPADAASINRVLLAVDEVLALGVDGVHFDDYFYHAKKGYKRSGNYQAVNAKLGSTVYKAPSASTKRANVNKMVRQVYNTVHNYEGKAFGISPAGNWENCMNAGADVKTWLSKTGYVDYLAPQIYWTDQWGSKGKTTMFSDRLNLFKKNDTAGIPLYAGLAAYRTGYAQSDDRGWGWKSNNLSTQLTKLRKAGYAGWILFSSADMYRSAARTELANFHFAIYPAKATGYNYPPTYKKGARFTIEGTLSTSGTTIRQVKAGVVKKSTGAWVSGHVYENAAVNAKTFDLAEAAPALKFQTLSPATYYYRVTVKDSMGFTKTVINKEFVVKWPFSATLTKAKKPPKTLYKGSSCSIKGKLKTSIPMRRVEVGIVKKSTGKWVYHYDKKINAKTFNVKKADSKMKFRKLARGKYYYRIIIHTDKGTRTMVNKAFKVK